MNRFLEALRSDRAPILEPTAANFTGRLPAAGPHRPAFVSIESRSPDLTGRQTLVIQAAGMADPFDTDIYNLAHDLLRTKRDKAASTAHLRADRSLGRGDLAGCLVWRRIAKAVEHIRSMERKTDMAA
jgi:hypothetical protein